MLCLTVLEKNDGTEKRSLIRLSYRNGISKISGTTISSITKRKQHNAIIMTQTIPLARLVLPICESDTASRVDASIGILLHGMPLGAYRV